MMVLSAYHGSGGAGGVRDSRAGALWVAGLGGGIGGPAESLAELLLKLDHV